MSDPIQSRKQNKTKNKTRQRRRRAEDYFEEQEEKLRPLVRRRYMQEDGATFSPTLSNPSSSSSTNDHSINLMPSGSPVLISTLTPTGSDNEQENNDQMEEESHVRNDNEIINQIINANINIKDENRMEEEKLHSPAAEHSAPPSASSQSLSVSSINNHDEADRFVDLILSRLAARMGPEFVNNHPAAGSASSASVPSSSAPAADNDRMNNDALHLDHQEDAQDDDPSSPSSSDSSSSSDSESDSSSSDSESDSDRSSAAAHRPDSSSSHSVKKSNHKKIRKENKRCAKEAANIIKLNILPKFKLPTDDQPSMKPWLESLEMQLIQFKDLLPSKQWYRTIMSTAIGAHDLDRERLAELVNRCLPWNKFCEAVTQEFDRKDYLETLGKKFFKLRQGIDSVQRYNDKFKKMMTELGLSKSLSSSEYNQQYLNGLDPSVAAAFERTKNQTEFNNNLLNRQSGNAPQPPLENVMLVCEKISRNLRNNPYKVGKDESKHSDHHRPTSGDRKHKFKREFKREKGKQYCSLHQWGGHATKDCRDLKKQSSINGSTSSSSSSSSSSGAQSSAKPSVSCHICRGPHYANQCPERKDNKPPQPGANQTTASPSNPWSLANKAAKTFVRQLLLSSRGRRNHTVPKQQKKEGKHHNPKKMDA